MAQKSFFEESVVQSKKDGLTLNEQSRSLSSDYYFHRLAFSLSNELSNSEPKWCGLYREHYGLLVKSFQLAPSVPEPPDSFLVEKGVYLPPNVLSKRT